VLYVGAELEGQAKAFFTSLPKGLTVKFPHNMPPCVARGSDVIDRSWWPS